MVFSRLALVMWVCLSGLCATHALTASPSFSAHENVSPMLGSHADAADLPFAQIASPFASPLEQPAVLRLLYVGNTQGAYLPCPT